MNVYELYFSPTGGTKAVADAVAEGWGGSCTPIDLLLGAEKKQYHAGDVCLVAVPSYGGRVPSAAVDRIRDLSGNGAWAVLIAVFGNRAIDDTLLELSDELQRAGFRVIAGMEAVAQHSLMPKYGTNRPDADDVTELHSFARQIQQALTAGTLSPAVELPGNRPYRDYKGVPLKPSVGSGCISCGRCAEECPVEAIPMMNCRTTDTKRCISCMHCVTVCPKHVRKVNKLMVFVASMAMKKDCTERKANHLYL